jgi:hypothetical protein
MHRVGARSRKRSLVGWHASALGSSVGDHSLRGRRALIFDPTPGRRTAVFRAGVESDGRLWCGAVDRVTTASNSVRRFGGRRRPAPKTTQS